MNLAAKTAPITAAIRAATADGARIVFERAAKPEAAEAEYRRPDDSARRVVEKKLLPVVPVHAGEKGGERAQNGDKPAEKDDLAAVFQKEVLPELEPPLVQADIVAIPVKRAESRTPARPNSRNCRR